MNATSSRDLGKDRLYKIVCDGMCIGCGLCASLAGPEKIRMAFVRNGDLRPHDTGTLSQELVDEIYDLFPSTRLDGLPPNLQGTGTIVDPIWGPYLAMWTAHATAPDTRIKAATGGVITALCRLLLVQGRVEFILQAAPSPDRHTAGLAQFSRSSQDLHRTTGSIYGPGSVLERLREALDLNQPFALVGKPGDLAAARNLARREPRVHQLVRYWLTPVYGGYVPPKRTEEFLAERDVDPATLTGFKYRSDGCPGDTEWQTSTGQSGAASMMDLHGDDGEATCALPLRCKLCPDGPGESADIAAGDQWVYDVLDPKLAGSDPRYNAVIVRTEISQELFEEACKAGYLTVDGAITPEFYDTCQHHHVTKKRVMRVRCDAALALGHTVPRSTGLLLDAMASRESNGTYYTQFEGAIFFNHRDGATCDIFLAQAYLDAAAAAELGVGTAVSFRRRTIMPLVKIEMFEGRTQAQKKAVAKGICEVFREVLGGSPDHSWIIFEDRSRDQWFVGPNSQTEINAKRQAAGGDD
ncbi:Coenzyme F420 hydrogenase/dehydrogenase, beta subunit C-terminal domain [uncultured Tateyamaria sp.]|uniref:Coenzyme F420 hydrogenase/dehydrogenase, beta subunit C-terminal domain n=1 Tax=uncultured Tateyamaria sp. TaxID=455651 RepID=UPI0026389301|nr:Coenzyme F420 hydrogenase/dehydrogenase, beta subunit C-terminal domain [uncultured Tateyamaria sp.]